MAMELRLRITVFVSVFVLAFPTFHVVIVRHRKRSKQLPFHAMKINERENEKSRIFYQLFSLPQLVRHVMTHISTTDVFFLCFSISLVPKACNLPYKNSAKAIQCTKLSEMTAEEMKMCWNEIANRSDVNKCLIGLGWKTFDDTRTTDSHTDCSTAELY